MTVQQVIHRISRELQDVSGVAGIVLGGSRARGTNHPASDIDIGIYYDESEGFDVREVGTIAAILDDERRDNLITSLGEWGPWVNGGGWLVVQGYHVDILFRDIKRVSQVIDDCLAGKVHPDYQTGHPHAYLNAMYMGEISICQILADPANRIATLKARTKPYPKPLKDAMIGRFLFEASFSLMLANGNADKDDISYVAGHVFRSIACLNHVLFAFNEEYCINEKKAVRMIEGFQARPDDYKRRIDKIISLISADFDNTKEGLEVLQELISETERLLKHRPA